MTGPLWNGTPFEAFASNLMTSPTHRLAYFMGQIDQTIHEVFGCHADASDVPDEARHVADLMMQTLSTSFSGEAVGDASAKAAAIIQQWRDRRSVN